MKPLPRIAAALAVLALSLPALAQKAPAETYYGIYLKSAKLGHMFQLKTENATWSGKPATKTIAKTTMDISMMGSNSTIRTESTVYADPKTGATLAEITRQEASGRTTEVKAVYTKTSVTYEANIMGALKTGTLTLKPGELFVQDPSDHPGAKPVPGTRIKGKVFSSDSQTLLDMEIVMGEKEPVVINGKAIAAYKVSSLGTIPSTSFVDDSGELLLSRVSLGIEIRREPKQVALSTTGMGKIDLAETVGTRPTGAPMGPSIRVSQRAVYELGRVTRPLPPSNSVQAWELIADAPAVEKGEKTLRVTIANGPLPDGPTVAPFAKPDDAPERLRKFLKPTLYTPSDDPQFLALAKTAAEGETDTARIAEKLVAFTHQRIKPDASIAAVRTARDIQQDPRGVCRDYTTYFTTLARALGIPTKQCTGMGYAAGIFMYHAWPEVWIGTDAAGKDRWVALEPTWGAPFADATHLKLAEGEVMDITSVAADMGRYTIKVIEIK